MIKRAIWFTTLLLLLPACAARQAADQPAFTIETNEDAAIDFMVLDEDTAVGEATLPLEAGTIDVQIPPAFYQRNPKAFQIQWIDFYR